MVPLGLVALNWLRLYLSLVSADLPQSPANRRQAESLGFAKAGFQALLAGAVSPLDLRIGAQFRADAADAIHAALREAADTITRMPATYLTYPNGGPILPVTRGRAVPRPAVLVLDTAYLAAFGEMGVPRDLWRAMQRFAAWVEPALMAEWARLMRGYAERQGRVLDEGRIGAAMTWADPVRDVSLPRGIALQALAQGSPVHCVWTGRRLDATVLDIDHCLPWAAWPCGDLWNLLPAHRRVNQHQKRDRLPSAMAWPEPRKACWLGGGRPISPLRAPSCPAASPTRPRLVFRRSAWRLAYPTSTRSMPPSDYSACACIRISRYRNGPVHERTK